MILRTRAYIHFYTGKIDKNSYSTFGKSVNAILGSERCFLFYWERESALQGTPHLWLWLSQFWQYAQLSQTEKCGVRRTYRKVCEFFTHTSNDFDQFVPTRRRMSLSVLHRPGPASMPVPFHTRLKHLFWRLLYSFRWQGNLPGLVRQNTENILLDAYMRPFPNHVHYGSVFELPSPWLDLWSYDPLFRKADSK